MDTARYINTKATDRSAAGFVLACADADPAGSPAGENHVMRRCGGIADGETSALVVRCVR